jgi:TIR domain-containing protein
MAEPVALKYRAFISYSHADTNWAKWLHRALEGFHVDKDLVGCETATGAIPKALRPIFRDRDEFTAGQTLSDQTLTALDASYTLIAICSPSAAKSPYVNEEIRLFKSRHPERAVIPLIVGGKPGDAELECFPQSLKLDSVGRMSKEPVQLLAADAREEGDGKSLALVKVVAGLLGVSSDDVFRRAERERRRRQRNWIAGLSVVAVALAGLAIWAEINRREAVAQRQEAERNFEIAKQGANSLVFDIAQSLRSQEGMRTETVRGILPSLTRGSHPSSLLKVTRQMHLSSFG